MGVPAFFKWLIEKYPKTVQDVLERRQAVVDGVVIPLNLNEDNPNGVEYDNLYVDMNGLIHPCSHPEDRDAPTSEFEMYVNVTKYVDRLFAAVRPRRLLFLAIDGVAPRAKMNQQRSRRFRSAQDAKERAEALQEVIEEMRIMGLSPPASKGPEWDSNVITPGTDFMSGLSTYLRFYILDRMNKDPAWKNIEVILSDASVPGEGEHKVMSFIRHQRTQPGYDPNQRHILHGLDADLIMLALATHEAHFTILREEVVFGKGRHQQKSEAKRMMEEMNNREGAAISSLRPEDEWVYAKALQRLDIAVLREYLAAEFSCLSVEGLLPFPFDLERILDDFVFLCFFVGNDFLPHLPSLDIRDGALDFLMESYKDLLPSMGDYITAPGGVVNLRQVDIILGRVGQVEDIVFQRKKAREDSEAAKKARNNSRRIGGGYDKHAGNTLLHNIRNNNGLTAHYKQFMRGDTTKEASDIVKSRLKTKQNEMIEKMKATVEDTIKLHESGWKDRYYGDTFKKEDLAQGGGLERMCHHYIKGLLWVFKYYYEGCVSWNWFYPFHYAPFASDLVNVDAYEIEFELSQPFHPFEQLLSVLPAESSHCLPEACSWLMIDSESPIIDIYNSDIPIDPNGKPLPWLWVLLIPFIDENRVRAAMSACAKNLTVEETRRNSWGPMLMFLHKESKVATYALSHIKYTPETAKAGEVYFDCEIGNGICGVLAEPPVIWYTPLDAVVSAPVRPFGVFTDVPANNVLTLVYRGPAVHPHQSKLLDGVRLDESILSAQDLIPRKQRVGRGQLNILEISQSTRSAEARGFGTDTMGVGPTGRVEYDSYGRVRSAGQGLMANSNFFQGGGNNFGDQRAMGESNSYSGRGGYGGSYPDQGRYNQLPPDRRGYDDRGYPPADRSYSGRSYPQNDSRDQGGRYGQQSNPPTGGGGGYSGYQYSGYEGAGRDPPRSAGGYGYGAPQQSYQRPDLGGGYPPGPGYNRPNSYAHSAPPSRGYE
ncbi:unnamed protein product, partial [Ectocarpus fasciculatus]